MPIYPMYTPRPPSVATTSTGPSSCEWAYDRGSRPLRTNCFSNGSGCSENFAFETCEPWEKALAFAVQSNVAAATGESALQESSYHEAEKQIAALPDPEDREILNATLRAIPRPAPRSVA